MSADDEYEKAARVVALAERAFPNLDDEQRLKRAARASEPSTSAALVPAARVAAVAALVEDVDFTLVGASAPPSPDVPPPVQESDRLDEMVDMLDLVDESVDALRVLDGDVLDKSTSIAALAAPQNPYLRGTALLAASVVPGSGRTTLMIAGAAVGVAMIGGAVAEYRRDKEEAAAAAAAEMAARDEKIESIGSVLSKLHGRVEHLGDATLKNAQLIAESSIASQAADAALMESATLDREIAHDQRQADREDRRYEIDRIYDELDDARADRLAERRQNALPEHDAGEAESPVADAIDRVLEKAQD